MLNKIVLGSLLCFFLYLYRSFFTILFDCGLLRKSFFYRCVERKKKKKFIIIIYLSLNSKKKKKKKKLTTLFFVTGHGGNELDRKGEKKK